MPTDELTLLADRFGSDKGAAVLCAHGYTRVYDAALGAVREKPLRLLEIGLIHGHTQNVLRGRLGEIGCPSLRMWAEYLPAATFFGFDIVDFRALSEPRMNIFQGDQGSRQDLTRMVEQAGGPFDIIIDDGSHASHHQQISLAVLFNYLAPGGLYCIEDLHYQPQDLEMVDISPTREFLRDLRFGRTGSRVALEQLEIAKLLTQIRAIHFFDSQSGRWPLAQLEDALGVIVKQGIHPLLGDVIGRLPSSLSASPWENRMRIANESSPQLERAKYCYSETLPRDQALNTVNLSLNAGQKASAQCQDGEFLSHTDYVSPGLQVIRPDIFFPNMVFGDTNRCGWPYLRREIPHHWYVDRRAPECGFVSRDEALILFNAALKFSGKRALEIGCWMGWSACHMALAGVHLDVIDPLLDQSPNRESVMHSLTSAINAFGTLGELLLVPGYSPEKVEELAAQPRKWSLVFIDGNHEAPHPLNDAIICEKYTEANAMILFHDLASPDVAEGLDYLESRGWKTMIYNTMQIMGVAWRGNIEPVMHIPDPRICGQLPSHLRHFAVSGGAQSVDALEF